jgi:hypothetical protein
MRWIGQIRIWQGLKNSVKNKEFKTIIHRWEPFGDISDLAKADSITFTVLSLGMPGGEAFKGGIVEFLNKNLEALYKGLK